jgi:hypothetical protein
MMRVKDLAFIAPLSVSIYELMPNKETPVAELYGHLSLLQSPAGTGARTCHGYCCLRIQEPGSRWGSNVVD